MTLKPTSSQGSGGGGSGTVTSVSSADTSIAVATGTTTPVLTAAALNTIAGNSATSGDVAMNSHKLTGLAAGSTAGNSLRYEQVIGSNVLAVSNLVAGTAGQVLQGTGPSYALPPGYEIGYAQITTPATIGDTSESTATALIAPGALTFDGAAVIAEFFCPQIVTDSASAGDVVVITLFEGSTQIGRFGSTRTLLTANQNVQAFYARFRFTPSAGAHTYKLCAFASSTTGTPQLNAGAGGTAAYVPTFIRFTKV